MTPNSAAYLPGTPGGQPMTPGTGGLDMMSPVLGRYLYFIYVSTSDRFYIHVFLFLWYVCIGYVITCNFVMYKILTIYGE